MQAGAQDIDGRLHQLGVDGHEQRRDRRVGGDHVPMPVDREGRIGLMRLEQSVDRRHGAGERGIVQRPVTENGCEAGGEQHGVALPQRDIEMLGQQ